jgi:GTP-binding protein
MFVDRAAIRVIGGRGGDGCVSFRRERFVPRGGPDGGDGGDGGSVSLVASRDTDSLSKIVHRVVYRAKRGGSGRGRNQHGPKGKDVVLPVPVGTLVYLQETGTVLCDLDREGARAVVARGGRGGRGNAHFATSTNRAPRRSEPGGEPEDRTIELELKLVADVGILGFPNAGKSTLLAAVSAARPKVADYPFTTLNPSLGTIDLPDRRYFTMADIPGLIEGAHDGRGLGHDFLRHIERTRVLLHLVDASAEDPAEAYRAIRNEIGLYDAALLRRPEVVAANKMDLPASKAGLAKLRAAAGPDVLPVSAAKQTGLDALIERLDRVLQGADYA